MMDFDALKLDEIIEHIFKFLPMKQLHSLARVSQRWRSIARKVMAHRHHIAWVLYENNGSGGLEEQIGKHMEVLASQPSVALLFCSFKLHEKPVAVNRGDRKRESLQLTSYLKRILPPSCCLYGLTTNGIVGSSFDMSKIAELETSKAASCLFLPKLEDIDVCSFELSEDEMSSNWPGGDQINTNSRLRRSSVEGSQLSPSDVDAITRISSDKNVRLVLLFLTDTDNNSDSLFAEALVQRYGRENTVVAGGFGFDLLTGETGARSRDPALSGLGIAFCGDRLRVMSVVLPTDLCDPEKVKERLRALGTDHQPHPNRSVGFMFACMGRGQAFYDGIKGVESNAFKQLYPGIPLLGFFGGGEIGFDFPHTPSSSNAIEFKLLHSYTTIFVLLTFA